MGNSSSKKGAPDASGKVGGGGGAPAGLPPISVEGRRDGGGEERKEGGSASPPSSPLAVPLPTPPFVVALRGGFEGAPMPNQFGLVLDVEALRLHSLEDNVSPLRRGAVRPAQERERRRGVCRAPLTSHHPLSPLPPSRPPLAQTLLRIYPYHTILCWGFDARTFQWRAFTNSKESEATVSGLGGRGGSGGLVCPAPATPPPPHPTIATRLSPSQTFTVLTFEGPEIERCMMLTVMSLMQKMQSRCVVLGRGVTAPPCAPPSPLHLTPTPSSPPPLHFWCAQVRPRGGLQAAERDPARAGRAGVRGALHRRSQAG
jgi:hypothetical protein